VPAARRAPRKAPKTAPATIRARTDLRPLLAALGLPDARESAVYLVGADGRIAWRARGGPDPAAAAGLARAPGAAP